MIKVVKYVLKIIKIVMRISNYIDFKLIMEDFKKDDTTGIFGKPKKRGDLTQYLMDREEDAERMEKHKAMEKRKHIRRPRNWRGHKEK
jgi:hypothetical protein